MTVFSAAAICARKNTLGMLAGFRCLLERHGSAELRLSGGSPEPDYRARVNDYIARHRLGERVKLLGRMPYEQVFEELGAASVFALVSLEENSPMGIEEAMAAGLSVVASNRCGMPYLVRDGETGYLVDPNDPQDIADRLDALLGDARLRAAMGERGRRVAQDRFHPDAVAQRTRAVYYRAARSGHRGNGRGNA
jgi:glycosyltransferase involved in cell wall biosynthesis